MTRKLRSLILAGVCALSTGPVLAAECAVEVSQALEASRQSYVDGMVGLANNNYSSRPGTYTSMACLDQFMQGGMDVFFRPPDLDSLLQQALSFACEQVNDAISGAMGGAGQGELLSIMSSLSGGLNVPSSAGGFTTVNPLDYFNINSGANTTAPLRAMLGGNS